MTLGDIIKEYRASHDMSMDDFSKASGISKGYISQLEKNINPKTGREPVPTIEYIRKAAKGMYMDFDALFAMLNDNSKVIVESSVVAKKSVQIPVLGNVAAGIPIEAVEDIIDYEEIPEKLAHTGEFFALKIKGDSMEPMIRNGSVAVVRQQTSAESGDVVIALVNGDNATCKRLMKYKDGLALIPNNAMYEPMRFTNQEILDKPVRIIGKVVEVRVKLE